MSAQAQTYKPPEIDTRPVAWSGDSARDLTLALAIIESAQLDTQRCAIALRADALSLPKSKDACIRALQTFVESSRQSQGWRKFMALAQDSDFARSRSADFDRGARLMQSMLADRALVQERLAR